MDSPPPYVRQDLGTQREGPSQYLALGSPPDLPRLCPHCGACPPTAASEPERRRSQPGCLGDCSLQARPPKSSLLMGRAHAHAFHGPRPHADGPGCTQRLSVCGLQLQPAGPASLWSRPPNPWINLPQRLKGSQGWMGRGSICGNRGEVVASEFLVSLSVQWDLEHQTQASLLSPRSFEARG